MLDWLKPAIAPSPPPKSPPKKSPFIDSIEWILAIEGETVSVSVAWVLATLLSKQFKLLTKEEICQSLDRYSLKSIVILTQNQLHCELEALINNGLNCGILALLSQPFSPEYECQCILDRISPDTNPCYFFEFSPYQIAQLISNINRLCFFGNEDFKLTQSFLRASIEKFNDDVMSPFQQLTFNQPTDPDFQEKLNLIIENFSDLVDPIMAHAKLVPNEEKQLRQAWNNIEEQIGSSIDNNLEDYEEIQTRLKQIFDRWYNIKTYQEPI